jgi:hypothetical protein
MGLFLVQPLWLLSERANISINYELTCSSLNPISFNA